MTTLKHLPPEHGCRRAEYGKYTIVHSSLLGTCSVFAQGLLVPNVVHVEDGDAAFEKCVKWCEDSELLPTRAA